MLFYIRKIFTRILNKTLGQERALLHQFPLLHIDSVLRILLAVTRVGIARSTIVLEQFVIHFSALTLLVHF